jgi:hypothetical protein
MRLQQILLNTISYDVGARSKRTLPFKVPANLVGAFGEPATTAPVARSRSTCAPAPPPVHTILNPWECYLSPGELIFSLIYHAPRTTSPQIYIYIFFVKSFYWPRRSNFSSRFQRCLGGAYRRTYLHLHARYRRWVSGVRPVFAVLSQLLRAAKKNNLGGYGPGRMILDSLYYIPHTKRIISP